MWGVSWNKLRDILWENGRNLPELKGKFYNCITNHITGRYTDPIEHHLHEIEKAVMLKYCGYTYNGLALKLKGCSWIYGCSEKDIKEG